MFFPTDYVPMRDATYLRAVDKECFNHVTNHPWNDSTTVVPIKNLQGWRKCFPRAKAVNLGKLVYGDKGVNKNLRGVWPKKHFQGMQSIEHLVITDTQFKAESFIYFPNLKTLECGNNPMVHSFPHLLGLRKLVMRERAIQGIIDHQALPELRTLHLYCFDFILPKSHLTNGAIWLSRLHHLDIMLQGHFRLLTPGDPRPFELHTVFPSQYFKAFKNLKTLSMTYKGDLYRDWGYRPCHFLHFQDLLHIEMWGLGDWFSSQFFSHLRERGVTWNVQNCHPFTQFVSQLAVPAAAFGCLCE